MVKGHNRKRQHSSESRNELYWNLFRFIKHVQGNNVDKHGAIV